MPQMRHLLVTPSVLNITYRPLGRLTGRILGWIVLKGLFDNVLSDYLWARAVMLTTPTIATVGLGLTVPLSVLASLTAALAASIDAK